MIGPAIRSAALLAPLLLAGAPGPAADPLPSWNDTAPRRAILSFVERVTKAGSADFVPPEQRIAVFDNDGTLWAEQPIYVQARFAMDRVKSLAPAHPEWAGKEPFAALLDGDEKRFLAGGQKSLAAAVAATHAGITTDEFEGIAKQWLATARHPKSGKPHTAMVYRPMLELLAHLRANGFKTWVVTGGGVEFVRAFSEEVYGVPPEQVVGSRGKLAFEMRDGKPVLVKLPEIEFVDDGPGKPAGIQAQIGRRPIAAFGNSDGDLPMLQWTAAGPGPRLAAVLHHTDGSREWAYDRESHIGRLDKALDAAKAEGWIVVDMKGDWNAVFPE